MSENLFSWGLLSDDSSVADKQFTDIAAFCAFATNGAFGDNAPDMIILIKIIKEIIIIIAVSGVGIAGSKFRTFFGNPVDEFFQCNLFSILKLIGRIGRKRCRIAERSIRRIEIHKSISVNKVKALTVVTTPDFGIPKCSADIHEIMCIADTGGFIPSHRNIIFSLLIDTIQAVETCLIQKNKK